MKKILVFLFLLLCSGLALAEPDKSILNPDAISQYSDMSVYYLSQIFGTVGNVLTNNSSQMLGQMFYTLNWGIFLISSIVIGYAVLLGTIRLASEGVTMSQGKSTLFMFLKLAIGVALVIPGASTGYSVLQVIVMEVVVKGVGLADSIWSRGLDYLNKGGVVWAKPKSINSNNPYASILQADSITTLLGSKGLASQIFFNEVCMLGSRDPLSVNNSNDGSSTLIADGMARPYYDVRVNEKLHRFEFPGLTDPANAGTSCGTASWDIKNACKDDTNCSIARDAVSKLIMNLLPAAQSYYCSQYGNQGTCVNRQPEGTTNAVLAPYLVGSLTSYYPAIEVYANLEAGNAGRGKTNFIKNAEQEGWLMAGRYYWNIMRFTRDQNDATNLAQYAPASVVSSPSMNDLSVAPTLQQIEQNSQNDFNTAFGSSEFKNALAIILAQAGRDSTQSLSNDTLFNIGEGYAAVSGTGINFGVSVTFMTTLIGMQVIANKFKSFDGNPISFLYDIGQDCLKLTIAIWIIGGISIAAAVAVMSVCAASNPLGFASSALAEWVKPLFMMIAAALWGAGFFLSYYVPLYPFIIFLFASLGWFISVIEAMVAAPLVALGMTHPENHDLLGKSEQALMLLLGVFMQPSLLVIGLIAGIIVSFVSFELLIYSFSGFMGDIMRGSSPMNPITHLAMGASTDNIYKAIVNSQLHDTRILIQPLLLVVFCVLTYTLLTQSFSLVYLLRDNVMKWIGVPASGLPNPEQLAHDTRGAVMGMGSQTGKAASDGMGGGTGALAKGATDYTKEKQKKDDQNSVNAPAEPQPGA